MVPGETSPKNFMAESLANLREYQHELENPLKEKRYAVSSRPKNLNMQYPHVRKASKSRNNGLRGGKLPISPSSYTLSNTDPRQHKMVALDAQMKHLAEK